MFDSATYAARRAELMRLVGSGCILLPGNDLVGMNYRANTFPFRQDGSFMYFTGLDRPGLCLWLDCESGRETLFGPELGLEHTIWSGAVPSLAELATRCGIDACGTMRELEDAVRQARGRTIHYPPAYQADATLLLSRLLSTATHEADAGFS
ncbi:MAG: aminopeptidase P N-terminal domain-containing protein, partial [Desulfomicrobium sp.]|nr:aminopeptidase P N-terminal domain-containing protein [Desulfomicrobium sp.]